MPQNISVGYFRQPYGNSKHPQTPGGGGGGAASVVNTYSASGAIAVVDTLSIITNASGTAAMTLSAGTVDQQTHVVKRYGAGTATVTAQIDGSSQTVTMNTASPLKESLTLVWQAALSSYIVE